MWLVVIQRLHSNIIRSFYNYENMCIIHTEIELTLPGITSFLEAQGFSAADAETLGVHLKVPASELKTLKKDNPGNVTSVFYGVINRWLHFCEPSQEKLADGLEKSGYVNIAKRVQGKKERAT